MARRIGSRALSGAIVALAMLSAIAVVSGSTPTAWPGLVTAALVLACAVLHVLHVSLLERRLRATGHRLAAMRENVLGDHALRARGIESIGARVAHEIKNPLTSIKSLLALEREETHGDDTQRRLEVIDGEVERIQRIVRDYLAYTRPLDRIRPRRVDLRELVGHVVEVFAGRSRAAAIDLVISGPSVTAEVDPHQLRGVLFNLLANAMDATSPGGTVGIEVAADGADVLLCVRDTGRGMSPELLGRIGTPYFTTREGGTGLGVVIARTTVEQHGGSLTYESTESVGTTATVRVPRTVQPGPDPTGSYDELVHPELAALIANEKAPSSRR